MCNICGYDKLSKTCFISDDSEDEIIPTSDNTKLVLNPAEYICANAEYLVNGRNPVTDAQLSASSVYAPHYEANWARLNTTPSLTTVGAWAAAIIDANQYIQVQFNGLSLVTGVALQGRPINTDPSIFTVGCCYQRQPFFGPTDTKTDKVFDGNTDQDTVVTSILPSQVTALCARVNPVAYVTHISLRFDILGCPLN
ncbi:adipocyte enhancer-binding protein 1-like [Mya arenaria]|uniref:adipocyte enhancer-binding protein 1-like n=1 Tax=Mya arenaria TaxID=6604 RepID=UPI0022E974F8|nr:adipocyte enhancer-binding protein 1-like [Mya arenaria]